MLNSKFTQITIKNKGNFIFNYFKTKWKNIFIVRNNIWHLNIQWKDFHCLYNFDLQLNPLVSNIEINFNPNTCKVKISNNLQQLILQDNSKLYSNNDETIKISNFTWYFYVGLFLFSFLLTILFLTKKYVKQNKFINYKG